MPLPSVFEFPVTVQQSEASVRCSLQGAYWLQVGEDTLMLKNTESKQKVMEWPYKLLRRYGGDKVRTVFFSTVKILMYSSSLTSSEISTVHYTSLYTYFCF